VFEKVRTRPESYALKTVLYDYITEPYNNSFDETYDFSRTNSSYPFSRSNSAKHFRIFNRPSDAHEIPPDRFRYLQKQSDNEKKRAHAGYVSSVYSQSIDPCNVFRDTRAQMAISNKKNLNRARHALETTRFCVKKFN
jgi:hypothetical protein